MPKPFPSLTHHGQARRLREMAIAALQHYPLPVQQVSLLAYHFNAIFRVDTTNGRKLVLRINLPGGRSLDEIRAETDWLAALRRDTPLIVPEPLPRPDGGLVTTIETRDIPEPRHCVVFSWVPGRDLVHQITPANYEKLGDITACLHDHAESWQPPAGFWIKSMDKVLPFNHRVIIYDQARHELLNEERCKIFQEASERVQATIDQLFQSHRSHILHADLHQGNLRLHRGNMHALDFDDAMLGVPVQDIGITFWYILAHPAYLDLRKAFQRGYESRRPWPETESGEVDTLIAGRELQLLNHLLTSDNPLLAPRLPAFVGRAEERLRNFLKE